MTTSQLIRQYQECTDIKRKRKLYARIKDVQRKTRRLEKMIEVSA